MQVTLEDQMICGALQTLNEEACEDVLDETEEDIPQTSLIPPSPEQTGEDYGHQNENVATFMELSNVNGSSNDYQTQARHRHNSRNES